MTEPRSDAFVFFGATGDLAYKKIFPALQALVRAGELDIPIIGVARAGWTLDKLRERARRSLDDNGGLDADAFARLSAQLKYVDGDYADPATYQRLKQTLGTATRPRVGVAVDGSEVEPVRTLGLDGEPQTLTAAPGRPLVVGAALAGRQVLFVEENGLFQPPVPGSAPSYPG